MNTNNLKELTLNDVNTETIKISKKLKDKGINNKPQQLYALFFDEDVKFCKKTNIKYNK